MKFFVYGTLMEGFENYNIYFKGKASSIKKGETEGLLYHLPEGYPAMIFGKGRVKGEIIEIGGDEILKKVDLLEEYKGKGEDNLYDRLWKEVEIESKERVPCWTYFYRDVEYVKKVGIPVPDGNWGKFFLEENEALTEKYFAWGPYIDTKAFEKLLEEKGCQKNFKILGMAELEDHELALNSKDEGFFHLVPSKGSQVKGVLYRVPKKALQIFDKGYKRKEVIVSLNNRNFAAVTYEKRGES